MTKKPPPIPPSATAFHNIAAMELQVKATAVQTMATQFQNSTSNPKQKIGKKLANAAALLTSAVADLQAIVQ